MRIQNEYEFLADSYAELFIEGKHNKTYVWDAAHFLSHTCMCITQKMT